MLCRRGGEYESRSHEEGGDETAHDGDSTTKNMISDATRPGSNSTCQHIDPESANTQKPRRDESGRGFRC